jgi:PAS domain S-box-containing protein
MKTITILLIEDNTQDKRLIKEMLKEIRSFNYNLVSAVTLKEGCEQIQRNNFDIILLDLNLPDSMGQQTFQKVIDCCKEIPVVLITGIEDEELSLKLIMEGAQDYIAKHSLNIAILGKAILYSIERQTLLRNIKIQKAEIIRIEKERILLAKFPSENPGPILRVDIDGKLLYINEAGIKLLPDWQLIINEIIPSRLKDIIDSIIIKGTNIIFELDHRELIYSFYAVPLFEEGYINLYGRNITEHKRAEEALIKSEEKFRDMVEQINDVIFMTDTNGIFTYLSPAVGILGGYKPEDMIGHFIGEFLDPLFAPKIIEQFQKVMTGILEPMEYRVKVKSGDYHWVRSSSKPILKENIPTGMRGMLTDITERKQAEEKLSKSEEKFRTIFSESPIGIELYDANGLKIFSNKSDLNMFGLTDISDDLGFNIFDGMTLNLENKGKLLKGESVAYQAIFDFERVKELQQFKTNRSGKAHFEYIITPLLDSERKTIHGYLLQVQDITERKQAEEALKESEESYRKLFENHSAVKIILDPDTGAILDANDAAAQYYGWTREELKHMKIYQINTQSPEEVNVKMKRQRSEKQIHFEFRHRRADGSIRDVEVFSSKIEIKGKDVFDSIIHDITERKRAELELILANKELAFQNEEKEKRANELIIANKALLQSEENFHRSISESPLGIRIISLEGETNYVNKAFLDIYEYNSLEEYRSIPAINRYTPESYAQHQIRKEKIKNGHAMFDYELSIVRGDAEVRYLKVWRKEILWNGVKHYMTFNLDITEQKQAEKTLQESEERFHSIYENSTIGIYRTTPDGKIILANPTLVKLLGYLSFEELSERNLEKDGFEPSYERTYFMDVMKREGEVKGLESAWTRMDGTTLFISESARAINDKEGKIIYYDGIVEDISLRKEAEQELIIANKELAFQNEEKEKRANELIIANIEMAFQNDEKEKRAAELSIANTELSFQNDEKEKRAQELIIANKAFLQSEENFRRSILESPLGIRIISIEGEIIYANKAFLDIYECNSLEEFTNTPALNRYTPESYAQHQERKEKRKNGSNIFDYEISIIRANAEIRHLKVWRKEILWNGTKHYQVINLDITEQKQAEQVVKVSEEKYRTILNASPDSILLTDLKGIITGVSEIGLELFGANTRDDLVGKKFFSFAPSEEKNTIKEIIEKTMIEGLTQNIELKIKKKNHSLFLSEISATLIHDPDGMPVSFMFIIRDISQRKKMESMQMHADRMSTLGEMASGIAHEINQPLNIISMVMDKILFESAKTETIDIEFLKNKSDKIFENITRTRNIIDHIRAFSRSHDDYVLTAFDINSSIENAASMIMEQFKHLGINLNFQLEKQIPQIVGNTYIFEQVILNLLVNAKDAVIEKKSKKLEYGDMIIGIRSYQENQFIIVEVTDNGIGISNDDINNIMLPFYTTKEEGKGTGLGLSICYQIIKEMNGTIDITSKRYHGTKIKIVLDIQKKK